MKYRLFEGGYESFLDNRVPEEYRAVVVDELPAKYIVVDSETIGSSRIDDLERRIEALERRGP